MIHCFCFNIHVAIGSNKATALVAMLCVFVFGGMNCIFFLVLCVCDCEKESVCTSVCVCVWIDEDVAVCVCVCVFERERVCVCTCVWLYEHVQEIVGWVCMCECGCRFLSKKRKIHKLD
jgi:hypothetical protein